MPALSLLSLLLDGSVVSCCVLLCLVVSILTHCCVCLFALGVFSVDEYE